MYVKQAIFLPWVGCFEGDYETFMIYNNKEFLVQVSSYEPLKEQKHSVCSLHIPLYLFPYFCERVAVSLKE